MWTEDHENRRGQGIWRANVPKRWFHATTAIFYCQGRKCQSIKISVDPGRSCVRNVTGMSWWEIYRSMRHLALTTLFFLVNSAGRWSRMIDLIPINSSVWLKVKLCEVIYLSLWKVKMNYFARLQWRKRRGQRAAMTDPEAEMALPLAPTKKPLIKKAIQITALLLCPVKSAENSVLLIG